MARTLGSQKSKAAAKLTSNDKKRSKPGGRKTLVYSSIAPTPQKKPPTLADDGLEIIDRALALADAHRRPRQRPPKPPTNPTLSEHGLEIVDGPSKGTMPSFVAEDNVVKSSNVLGAHAGPGNSNKKKNEEIQVLGTANKQALPHMRQDCLEYLHGKNNLLFCGLCYCYVCDKPAKDCNTWNCHCNAIKNPHWTRLRHLARQQQQL